MSLKFIALSGTTGVTENMYVYEYESEMIVVDCGVGFPESDMLGVDLVIPDFSYIRENKDRLKAILVTHGHEDHLGALPFLLRDVNVPIYASGLVAGFIKDKLEDYKIKDADIRVFDPDRDQLSIGSFKITPFRVSHSVPDGVGFCIDTPEGKAFHVADYKFDWSPVDNRPFDVQKAANLAQGGVLLLASDALGSTTAGYTRSEREIEERIEGIAHEAKGNIFFTTISSNISRMQQAMNVAQRLGRNVALIGRSVERKANIAAELGLINFPDNLMTYRDVKKKGGINMLYIISGSYGQSGSALDRVANGEHEFLSIKEGDVVIFSSDPAPPGSKQNVDAVVDKLFETGADVHYYDIQEDLHVSGHGSQQDIQMLFGIVKPKYYIPIGATIRHMRAYSKLAKAMGAKAEEALELLPGEGVEFKDSGVRKLDRISIKEVLVDGLGIGDVGNVVLRDRKILSKEGVVIALIQIEDKTNKLISGPEIISRGFVFEKQNAKLLEIAGKRLEVELYKRKKLDRQTARHTAIDFLEKFFFAETGRRPMILPVIV